MDEQKVAGKCEGGMCGACASCTTSQGGMCSPMHWSCCIIPLLSIILWVGGIVSLVLAWVAGESLALGFDALFWYVNALTLGVLATGARSKKIGACRKGGCGHGSCGDCKDGTCK